MPKTYPPVARQRLPRSSVTPEGILDAAERVSTGGLDALTIRAVATEMGSSPMAPYRCFATKDDLVDALLDRILGGLAAPEPSEDWAADLAGFARAHRMLLALHPWAIVPLFTRPNPGLNATRIGELALEILSRGGITGGDAVADFCGILALNYGWSAFASARSAATRIDQDPGVAIGAAIAALPAGRFPRTRAVADQMSAYGSDEHYERALRQLVAGIRDSAGVTDGTR